MREPRGRTVRGLFFFTRRKRLFPDGFVGKGIGCHQVRSGWITGRVARSLSRNDWVIRAWAPSFPWRAAMHGLMDWARVRVFGCLG